MERISAAEAADILGVSSATVRNWRQAGHLSTHGQRPIAFDKDEVLALQEQILSNRFSRLRTRANKSAAGIAPANPQPDTARVLFHRALRLLREKGEVESRGRNNAEPNAMAWRRNSLRNIMQNWFRRLASEVDNRIDPLPDVFPPKKTTAKTAMIRLDNCIRNCRPSAKKRGQARISRRGK